MIFQLIWFYINKEKLVSAGNSTNVWRFHICFISYHINYEPISPVNKGFINKSIKSWCQGSPCYLVYYSFAASFLLLYEECLGGCESRMSVNESMVTI